MIWDTTKTATAVFPNGEEVTFKWRVPTMRDYEELGETDGSNETYLKKFLISCDGFKDVEELATTGGAQSLIKVIINAIGESANVEVALKNA